MSCRSDLASLLPLYAAGTLEASQHAAVAAHLAGCPDCQSELSLWELVGATVVSEDSSLPEPDGKPLEAALAATRRRHPSQLAAIPALLRSQALLLRREIWLASALVMAIGYVGTVITGPKARGASFIEVLAPLIAAAGVAVIYGPESDPNIELALATPTSPRRVLLARLALVFGYDLALALIATVALLATGPSPDALGQMILNWLGPMTFLSALALLLSLRMSTGNATGVAFALWLVRWLVRGAAAEAISPDLFATATGSLTAAYESLWTNQLLLVCLAALLVLIALLVVDRSEPYLASPGP